MFVAAIACSTACVTTVGNGDDLDCSDGRCDTVDQTCTDTRYGDGVCQTQIDCQVPDIDCFIRPYYHPPQIHTTYQPKTTRNLSKFKLSLSL